MVNAELQYAYENQQTMEERIAELEEALYGQHQPEGEAEEPEEDPP